MQTQSATEVIADVAMLKLTVYGNEHLIGLDDRLDKVEYRINQVEKDSADILSQFKGAISTLKLLGSIAIGFVAILASAVEIYRAIR